MENIKIAISNELKDKTVKEQLRDFLMSDDGCIPIEDAIKEADKKLSK